MQRYFRPAQSVSRERRTLRILLTSNDGTNLVSPLDSERRERVAHLAVADKC